MLIDSLVSLVCEVNYILHKPISSCYSVDIINGATQALYIERLTVEKSSCFSNKCILRNKVHIKVIH